MTRRQAIRAAMLAALNASPPSGVPDADQRKGPYSVGALPAIRLVTGPKEAVEPASNRRGPTVQRRCQFLLEHCAESDDGVEPLLAHGTKTLVDNRLGGLAMEIEEIETNWEQAPLDADYVKATQVFVVLYKTAANDQEA